MTLPRLQRGANRVRFAAGPPQETLTLQPTLHSGAEYSWTVSADSHTGLTSMTAYQGYSSAITVPTLADVPGTVTWRIDTPALFLGRPGLHHGGRIRCRYGADLE